MLRPQPLWLHGSPLCPEARANGYMATTKRFAFRRQGGNTESLTKLYVYSEVLDEHICWGVRLGNIKNSQDDHGHQKKHAVTIQSFLFAGSACFFVTRRSNPFDGGKGEVTICFCGGVFKTLGAAAAPGLAAGEGLAARSAFNLSRRSFAAWDAGG